MPLDFAVSYKNKEIPELIRNKFKTLTSTEISVNNYDNLNKKSVKSKNFDIFFPHHSQDEIRNKFKNRINRFYEILESDKRVLFIRKNHFDIPMTGEDAHLIKESIEEVNPKLNFKLLVVNEKYPDDTIENIEDDKIIYKTFIGTHRSCNSEKAEDGQGFNTCSRSHITRKMWKDLLLELYYD